MIMYWYLIDDKVLILYEDMVRYWYCANIPPRPLDYKTAGMGKVD